MPCKKDFLLLTFHFPIPLPVTDNTMGKVSSYHFPRTNQFTCVSFNASESKGNSLLLRACKHQDHDPVQHGNSQVYSLLKK